MTLQRIHLRINDAATGRPTPVRLRVTDAAGIYYPPLGRAAEFATGVGEDVGGNLRLGRECWAYIDGACEIAVPPGDLTFEARKGPEYRPLRETVHLPAGKLALRFALDRWINLRDAGWYSGDIRAHFISPHSALLEAAAEDLAMVNVLAREYSLLANDGQSYLTETNLIAFSGQRSSLEGDGHLVAVNTLNTHPILGKLGLLNCHRVVYPLAFGGPDHSDDWSLADWCGQCHRKNGLVVWADAFNPKIGNAGQALANVILGQVDAIEMDLHDPVRMRSWYHLLNAGIRMPIVGGSAKDSNRIPLGFVRTYARVRAGEAFSYPAWIEALRGGRTYITTEPLISFHADDGGQGTIQHLIAGATSFRASFSASALETIERAELIVNGAVATTGDGKEREADLDMPAGGWLAVRCWRGGHVVAHTSPQYVRVEGVPPPVDPTAVAFLDGHLQRTRDWIVTEGRFEKPASRERLIAVVDAARQSLAQRLGNAPPNRR